MQKKIVNICNKQAQKEMSSFSRLASQQLKSSEDHS